MVMDRLGNAVAPSPRIVTLSWGRIEVEGGRVFKDAKLYPGGACEWDWRETGTQHSPGIRPADVDQLLDRGATVVILAQGMEGRLDVCPDTTALLGERGIETFLLRTEAAVKLYNELRTNKEIGGLFHSTC